MREEVDDSRARILQRAEPTRVPAQVPEHICADTEWFGVLRQQRNMCARSRVDEAGAPSQSQ